MLTTKFRLGDLLVKKGLITEVQLKVALEEQKIKNKRLGEILVDLGYIDEKKIIEVLADQLKIQAITAKDVKVTPDLQKIISESRALRLQILPIKIEENTLHVATTDPTNIIALDEIERITNKELVVYIVLKQDFLTLFSKIYSAEDNLYKIAKNIEDKILEAGADEKFLEKLAEETPAIKLVDNIIKKAITENASDVHIEAEEDILRIRFRIDGILHEILTLNKLLYAPILSRIKIISNLNIAEKRLPQDGRFKVSLKGREVDFRVSTLPTIFGEKVVLRVLDKSQDLLDLNKLGIDDYNFETYKSIIDKPTGIILISGPTGSGKTTTLYATLNYLNSIEKNIITVEDPVEYKFKLINQVQIEEKIGLTFAGALRSILRQDPDIVMIGEIRDKETAEIAIQASLTGHLVLSTIHTNDAVSSVTRLVDMGIEPFLVSASIVGVVSQRLVRRICDNCKESFIFDKDFLKEIELETEEDSIELYWGKGCEVCDGTGYRGRVALYEILKITRELKDVISRNETAATIKKIAISQGFKPMYNSGMELVKKGITTVEEVMRVTIIEQE
jgi:type IV pilus assembly protein PilB